MTIDYRETAKKIIEFATSLVEAEFAAELVFERQHAVKSALALAWLNNIREGWEKVVEVNPVLKERVAIAKMLMAEAGHDQDYVVGTPGQEPFICMVDGKKAVCFDVTMAAVAVMPLSAVYADKASEVLDAAEKVTAAAQATAHKGDIWPLRTAGGDTFNSLEEMAESKNQYVRGLAESFKKTHEEVEKKMADILNEGSFYDSTHGRGPIHGDSTGEPPDVL